MITSDDIGELRCSECGRSRGSAASYSRPGQSGLGVVYGWTSLTAEFAVQEPAVRVRVITRAKGPVFALLRVGSTVPHRSA